MTYANQLRVLIAALNALEAVERNGGLRSWQREFLRQGRKLRVKLQQKVSV